MPNLATAIALAVELSLLVVGLMLLWRLILSPAARAQPRNAALSPWAVTPSDFFLFLWFVIGGATLGSLTFGQLFGGDSLTLDTKAVIATGASQLGMLAGMGLFWKFFDRNKNPAEPNHGFLLSGLATFAIAMPVVTAVSLLWQLLLGLIGLPVEKQDLIRLFTEAESPALLATMIALACVGAPLVEELVFRAGIFRYTRTRLPRWAGLLLPACLFGALHDLNLTSFAPLVTLGIIFSLAYERTGRIGTAIVAHALFNLNSVVLILANLGI